MSEKSYFDGEFAWGPKTVEEILMDINKAPEKPKEYKNKRNTFGGRPETNTDRDLDLSLLQDEMHKIFNSSDLNDTSVYVTASEMNSRSPSFNYKQKESTETEKIDSEDVIEIESDESSDIIDLSNESNNIDNYEQLESQNENSFTEKEHNSSVDNPQNTSTVESQISDVDSLEKSSKKNNSPDSSYFYDSLQSKNDISGVANLSKPSLSSNETYDYVGDIFDENKEKIGRIRYSINPNIIVQSEDDDEGWSEASTLPSEHNKHESEAINESDNSNTFSNDSFDLDNTFDRIDRILKGQYTSVKQLVDETQPKFPDSTTLSPCKENLSPNPINRKYISPSASKFSSTHLSPAVKKPDFQFKTPQSSLLPPPTKSASKSAIKSKIPKYSPKPNQYSNIVSPVAIYIKNSSTHYLQRNNPKRLVNHLPTGSKRNKIIPDFDLPQIVYQPAAKKIVHHMPEIKIPESINKLICPVHLTKHEKRFGVISRDISQFEKDNNHSNVAPNSDISVLYTGKKYIL